MLTTLYVKDINYKNNSLLKCTNKNTVYYEKLISHRISDENNLLYYRSIRLHSARSLLSIMMIDINSFLRYKLTIKLYTVALDDEYIVKLRRIV